MRIILVWLVLFIGGGLAVFEVKNRVEQISRELAVLNQQLLSEQRQIGLLHARWAELNEPRRLRRLARRHLPGLRAPQMGQILPIERLERRRLAVAPVGTVGSPARRQQALGTRLAPLMLPAQDLGRGGRKEGSAP